MGPSNNHNIESINRRLNALTDRVTAVERLLVGLLENKRFRLQKSFYVQDDHADMVWELDNMVAKVSWDSIYIKSWAGNQAIKKVIELSDIKEFVD